MVSHARGVSPHLEKSLGEYRRKRRFDRTTEPKGRVAAAPATRRAFVVQKHEASHLHFDFRLQLDGTLKSWALPKGPSLDPAVKRLAVQVEDHPIEYGSFEGTIPEGEYGGGTVMAWDRGTWEPIGDPHAAFREGKLKFNLHGERLQGRWNIVRMAGKRGGNGRNWLLFKSKDDASRTGTDADIAQGETTSVASRRTMSEIASGDGDQDARPSQKKRRRTSESAAMPVSGRRRRSQDGDDSFGAGRLTNAFESEQPRTWSPQLALLVERPPEGPQWLHEIKFDGYRLLSVVREGEVRLITRRGQDWTARYATIAQAMSSWPTNAIVDGELISVDAEGRAGFQALQNAMNAPEAGRLQLHLFDIVHGAGWDVSRAPLRERKALLARLVKALPTTTRAHIFFSEHVQGHGVQLHQHACRQGIEGIVSKQADAPYEPGRPGTWVKTKCSARQEFVIGGFTDPAGSRTGFGAILVGYYEGSRLTYAGRVGTGFNVATLRSLSRRLKGMRSITCPFDPAPESSERRGATWVTPSLVAEVEFSQWTRDGRLRHPSFQGLREDKEARDVVREQPRPLSEAVPPRKRTQAAPSKPASRRATAASSAEGASVAGVTLSNSHRVLYPDEQITKIDLARHYERVASLILPHISDRPLSIVRCPQGLGSGRKGCFFQKHLQGTLPPSLRGVTLREKDASGRYVVVDDLAGVVSLVQLSVLEIHSWGSRAKEVSHPDRLVFDLDPGEGVAWREVIDAARTVRDLLLEVNLRSFVQTSGGKGLHVVVPLVPRAKWKDAAAFAEAVADVLATRHPKKYVATTGKHERRGRIYVDHLRNTRGATSVCPYSTRARLNAPVATPLSWSELPRLRSADAFTVRTFARRLDRRPVDPWKEFFEVDQALPRPPL